MSEYSVQRFRGGYAIVYHDATGKRHRERLYAADRPSAEAEARQRWQLGAGEHRTVGSIVEAYIADREIAGIVSTGRQRDAWKAMKGFWATVDPALIDREMAQAYGERRKVADATLRYELGMLSVALRWAKEKRFLDVLPEIWRPDPPERTKRHLTHAEFERFFDAVRAPHARLYVLLGLYTMARPTALLELTWDRVDLERGTIDLNPAGRRQTRKRRPIVALNDEAIAALREAHAARQSDYVIERGAAQVRNIKKAFQAASQRCGLRVTPYMLRHTGAVWAAEAGTDMEELAQFMGHDDSTTTTKHYARFSPGFLRGVAKAVQRRPNAR
jgi:integrase